MGWNAIKNNQLIIDTNSEMQEMTMTLHRFLEAKTIFPLW